MGRIVAFPGVAYEELPVGTRLHPGMPLSYRGERVTVARKGCCGNAPVFLYEDGSRLCLVCGLTAGTHPDTVGG